MIFSVFSNKSGFGVFLVHSPMASVLLSASVERCFVSRMRDFFLYSLARLLHSKTSKNIPSKHITIVSKFFFLLRTLRLKD